MKAYKAKKANEPDDKSEEESKPKKKGAVKEFMDKKKENNKKKTSSPRKSGDSQKFKSAEFVETDDSSSENEGDVSFICNSFASASPAVQTYFRLSVLVFFHEEKRQTEIRLSRRLASAPFQRNLGSNCPSISQNNNHLPSLI